MTKQIINQGQYFPSLRPDTSFYDKKKLPLRLLYNSRWSWFSFFFPVFFFHSEELSVSVWFKKFKNHIRDFEQWVKKTCPQMTWTEEQNHRKTFKTKFLPEIFLGKVSAVTNLVHPKPFSFNILLLFMCFTSFPVLLSSSIFLGISIPPFPSL